MSTIEHLQRRLAELEADKRRVEEVLQRAEADKQRAEADKQQVEEENRQLRETLAEKEQALQALLKRFFGRRSERFVQDPQQLLLEFGDAEQVADALEGMRQAEEENEQDTVVYKRRRPRREKLPENLPREIVEVDLPEEEKVGRTCIGYDPVETLVYRPAELYIRETRYLKYVVPTNPQAGVRQPERAPGLVEGNRYDTSVAAWIITAKYGYHLPVYRLEDYFAGCGWNPSRGTMLNLLAASARLIRPLIAFFADEVRRDRVIGTDDTGVTLLLPKHVPKIDPLDPKSGRVHDVIGEALRQGKRSVPAKMWSYRGVHVPLNVFDFTVSRHRDGPDLFLIDHDYEGTLLGDCYSANTGIVMRSSGSIIHAACVAHARRKVYDARDYHAAHAEALLAMFGQLYDIEHRGAELDDAGRLELRQREARPVWDRIRCYIDTQLADLLPKEALAAAVRYIQNQWDALTRYLDDGAIPIDNNETEQLMKQVAVGRKNWLFIGSVEAGYRAADLMTLVSSAVRNDLDVWVYVKDVLDALLAGSADFASLRPDVWAAAHPEHIRQYRVDQRTDRRQRTHHRRASRR